MAIDIFTPETLDAVVRQIPSKGSFFKDTFFNNSKSLYTRDVRIDFKKGGRSLAPFINKKANGVVIDRVGFTSETYETPLIKMKDVTDIEDQLKRLPGEVLQNSGITPEERGIELLTEVLVDFNDRIDRRSEWMCVKALMDGVIPIKGEGVDEEIDFGFTNKITPSVLWDSASGTPKVYEDLQAAALKCRVDGYRNPNVLVFERSAWQAFLQATKKDEYYKQQPQIFDIMAVKPERRSDTVVFMGRLKDPDLDIYVYDEYYYDEETKKTVSLMPKGKVLMASTNARYDFYYGLLDYADEETNTIKSVVAEKLADSWVQKEPAIRQLAMSSRPLPVPQEVDSWCVLTVSATE